MGLPDKPTVVCLCGSTRFQDEFLEAIKRETMAGRIVLATSLTGADDDFFNGWSPDEKIKQKLMLNALHWAKIEMCDEILVINVDGYVGRSTAREILYAEALKKKVRWWTNELP